ncbi:MAG: hypothetical protein SGPRY_002238 [Prymnesium sp.]
MAPARKRRLEEPKGSPPPSLPPPPPLPSSWEQWVASLTRLFASVFSVAYLLSQRDVEPSLSAVLYSLSRVSEEHVGPLPIRLLANLCPEFISLLPSPGGESLLLIDCQKKKPSSTKPRPRGREGSLSFSSKRNARLPSHLPALLSERQESVRHILRVYAEGAASRGETPPPLDSEGKEKEEGAGKEPESTHGPDGSDSGESCMEAWKEGEKVNTRNVCSFLMRQDGYASQLVHTRSEPPREGRFVPLQTVHMPPALSAAYRARGISRLFSHQAEALSAMQGGQHVILSTPTSSGKSLVYSVAAVSAVTADPYARAMFLFPTKALAQDQLKNFSALAEDACPSLLAATLDGDTSQPDRRQLCRRCHVFLTNPDLLHATLLPNHGEWAEVLANLKLLVVDEAHAYHGVFGSHVSLVLRRLRRLCTHYRASPRIVCCSATIGQPREHMAALTGLPLEAIASIERDGSPSGWRSFALWNPPPLRSIEVMEWHEKLPPGTARRRLSSLGEAARLLSLFVSHQIRTIAFVHARSVAELLLQRTHELLPSGNYIGRNLSRSLHEVRSRVTSYRAGYLKEKRREVEAALFGGSLLAVVATNALELGVDIGSLDATIHVGYPGSKASLAQQAGRAGRGCADSIALMIAGDNPLEQHPRALLDQRLEAVALNPYNHKLLAAHLIAAAEELPLRLPSRRSEGVREVEPEPETELGLWVQWSGAAQAGVRDGALRLQDERLHCAAKRCGEARRINLRDIDSRRLRVIVCSRREELQELETMEADAACLRL